MQRDKRRFRKRPYHAPTDKALHAGSLRQIGEHIQRHEYAVGMALVNQALSDVALTRAEQSRWLSLVADSEFKRGRFREAAQIHLQAAIHSMSHSSLWLRSHIGQVRALLKVPQVEDAVTIAHQAVAVAEAKMAEFDKQVCQANKNLQVSGSLRIPPVPLRVSIVATRMGYLFLQEGEPEAASEFFEKAIQSSKGGANRARQGMAQLALARGDYGAAVNLSADAIRRGGFKAKTLPAWNTLIAARRHLPGWRISSRLIQGLDSIPAGLRARTILTIVRELRKSDMRQWREVAEKWLDKEGAAFPIVAAELRKLILASAKTALGDFADKREKANLLLQTEGLSSTEWVAAAKEWLRASLWEGRSVDIKRLIADAVSAYGCEIEPRVAHSMALSCIKANRQDLARSLLQRSVQTAARDSDVWGKSSWALARMEGSLGNHALAARLYWKISEQNSIAPPFRLRAQLHWLEMTMRDGTTDALLEAKPVMTSVLGQVQDPDILLNFARQLSVTSPELADWGVTLFRQGVALAIQQFEAAKHPSAAADILFKLTRRQVCDFDRCADAIQQWEGLSEEKVEWLWSPRSSFWQTIGLIVRAYGMEGKSEQMKAFAASWLDDPATPPEGQVQVGIPYGRWMVRNQGVGEALVLFDRLVRESPTHPLCAVAWYWKALEAHKRGNMAERNRCAGCLRLATGTEGGDPQERDLGGKAVLLLANLDVTQVDPQAVKYMPEDYDRFRLQILQGVALLP